MKNHSPEKEFSAHPRSVYSPSHGHVWGDWKFVSFNLTCCHHCGNVRRDDDRNAPCKGVVRLTLRSFEPVKQGLAHDNLTVEETDAIGVTSQSLAG